MKSPLTESLLENEVPQNSNHINPEDSSFRTSESVALAVVGAFERTNSTDLLRQCLAAIPREHLITAYNQTFGNA